MYINIFSFRVSTISSAPPSAGAPSSSAAQVSFNASSTAPVATAAVSSAALECFQFTSQLCQLEIKD